MRDCMDYIELISARLDGGLTAGQEAELNEHLAACPVCRALAEELFDFRRASLSAVGRVRAADEYRAFLQ